MIVDAIWGFLYTVINAIIGVFPNFGTANWSSSGVYQAGKDAASTVGLKVAIFRNLVDMQWFGTLATVFLAALTVAASIKVLVWVYNVLPGKAA